MTKIPKMGTLESAREQSRVHIKPARLDGPKHLLKQSSPIVDSKLKYGKKNLILAPETKTRVGNRKELLRDLDHRDVRVRRTKEIYFEIMRDLGGVGALSTFQDIQAKQLAFLVTQSEELLRKWAQHDDSFDQIEYMMYTKLCAQIGKQLGLSRYIHVGSKKRKMEDLEQPLPDKDESLEDFLAKEHRRARHRKAFKAKRVFG